MNYIERLNKEELEELKKELETNPHNVTERIKKRLQYITSQQERMNPEDYSITRLAFYRKEFEEEIEERLAEYRVEDLSFLYDDIEYSLYSDVLRYENISMFKEEIPFTILDRFLEKNHRTENAQDVYNTLNYIKNYFYYRKGQGISLEKQEIMTEWQEKQEILGPNLKELAGYLYSIKDQTPLRISVANNSLSRMKKKKEGIELTPIQSDFIATVAFGSDIKKLRKGNYEDSKRLIYLAK